MTRNCQTGNTTAKFCIPLWRARIASQFLHWNCEGKNYNFSQVAAKNMQTLCFRSADDTLILLIFGGQVWFFCIFTLKVSIQKVTSYPSFLQWNAKFGGGISSFTVPRLSPKEKKGLFSRWYAKLGSGSTRKKLILQNSGGWVPKNVNFYPQSV